MGLCPTPTADAASPLSANTATHTLRGSMRGHLTGSILGQRVLVLVGVALCSAIVQPGVAREAAPPTQAQPASAEVLTDEDVIKLVKAGMGDSVIIAKIKNSRTKFDTSPDSLIQLKQLGVSEAVLEAMASSASAKAPPAPVDPNDPLSPHEPGIYLMKTARQSRQMVLLEPAAYSQMKLGGAPRVLLPVPVGVAMKSKWKAIVRGERARLRVSEPRPVFYFYFERALAASAAAADTQAPRTPAPSRGVSFAASGPNQFTLAKFESKNGERELVIGEMGGIGTTISMGVSPKDAVEFDFEKLAPGIYKVTPRVDLPPGEYCFLYSGASPGLAIQMFDFGITPAQ